MAKKQNKKPTQKKVEKKSKGLSWATMIFIYVKAVMGLLIFFYSGSVINISPYKEISSILGVAVILTSGVQITFTNKPNWSPTG